MLRSMRLNWMLVLGGSMFVFGLLVGDYPRAVVGVCLLLVCVVNNVIVARQQQNKPSPIALVRLQYLLIAVVVVVMVGSFIIPAWR